MLRGGLFFQKKSHASTTCPSGNLQYPTSFPPASFLEKDWPPTLTQYRLDGLAIAAILLSLAGEVHAVMKIIENASKLRVMVFFIS